jgi:hypothetical protein
MTIAASTWHHFMRSYRLMTCLPLMVVIVTTDAWCPATKKPALVHRLFLVKDRGFDPTTAPQGAETFLIPDS